MVGHIVTREPRRATDPGATEVIVAAALAFFHAALMAQAWNGNFFNSYHYISDDGFDWITQGLAFNQLLSGADTSAWPVLRQPVFVLVSALDSATGGGGIAFLLAQTAAVGATALAIGRFARSKGLGSWAIASIVLAFYFFVFGFYRLWVLSDTIAAAFMTISVTLALSALWKPNGGLVKGMTRLFPAVIVTTLAGLTQTYGLIPFLVVCGVYALGGLIGRKGLAAVAAPTIAAIVAAGLVFGGQALWVASIPHGSVPTQFGLLQLNLNMGRFYLNVWLLSFAALVPAILMGGYAKLRGRSMPRLEEWALVATVVAFAALSLIYQWAESRLTFMYWPIVCLALVAWCAPSGTVETANIEAVDVETGGATRGGATRAALVASGFISVAISLLVVPGDYWRPLLRHTHIDPGSTWVANVLRDGPQDRFYLQTQCSGMADMCARAVHDPQASPYRNMMFEEYMRRTTQITAAPAQPATP